jgi:hypothetical protein
MVAPPPVDFRKGAEGLAALVREAIAPHACVGARPETRHSARRRALPIVFAAAAQHHDATGRHGRWIGI